MTLKQCLLKGQEEGDEVGSEIKDLCSTLYLALDARLGVFRWEPRGAVGVHNDATFRCTLRHEEETYEAGRTYLTNWVESLYPGGAPSTTAESESIRRAVAEDESRYSGGDLPKVEPPAPRNPGHLSRNSSVTIADLLASKQEERSQPLPRGCGQSNPGGVDATGGSQSTATTRFRRTTARSTTRAEEAGSSASSMGLRCSYFLGQVRSKQARSEQISRRRLSVN